MIVPLSTQLHASPCPDNHTYKPFLYNKPTFNPGASIFSLRPSLNIDPLLLYNVEVVPVVALLDHQLAGLDDPLEHGVQHLLHLLLVEGAEQKDVADGLGQSLALLVRLREDHLAAVVLVLLGVVSLGEDGLATSRKSTNRWFWNN